MVLVLGQATLTQEEMERMRRTVDNAGHDDGQLTKARGLFQEILGQLERANGRLTRIDTTLVGVLRDIFGAQPTAGEALAKDSHTDSPIIAARVGRALQLLNNRIDGIEGTIDGFSKL